MKARLFFLILFSAIFLHSCTKLTETVRGNLTPGQITNNPPDALLKGVYASMEYTFTSYQEMFALCGITSDEAIAPTRATDWDDNGSWRALHQHRWDANNPHIHDCFTSLGGIVYTATDLLHYNPSVQQQAEARFLRAFAMYFLLDMFDQVPYRETGESVIEPARVRKGLNALRYIINEINAVEPDLPDGLANKNKANKSAAKVLLMKCYLNKAVYADRLNPVFDSKDMDTVIHLADDIIKSGLYQFSENYFDNFAPDNAEKGKENIFTQQSSSNANYKLSFAWLTVLHYNQYNYYGGYNGFATLDSFYRKFDVGDKRRGVPYDYPSSFPNPGKRINVGFLVGQQYDLSTNDAIYVNNIPLIYTTGVKNLEPGPNVTMTGIRPLKYAPDQSNFGQDDHPSNNFVYFRFPDVLLMKAEAILRGGTPSNVGAYGVTAQEIVNSVRTDQSRSAPNLPSINDSILLDERGRELWWEGWRRQDMIRFKKFLDPFQEKEYRSDQKYLLFPIPDEQLVVNPNLVQNPRY